MKIDFDQAYEIAERELQGQFTIIACTELPDSLIFSFSRDDGFGFFLPPLQVTKDGKCSLWETKMHAIESDEWLEKHGRRIDIGALRK